LVSLWFLFGINNFTRDCQPSPFLAKVEHRMRYKTFINSGLSIGSGAVESAVKHLVQQRMKRPGMRWRAIGADSMLNLRCIFRSTGKWSDFWCCKKNALKAA
jgi:hypothetical protein